MAALICAPSEQGEEALPGFVDAADADPAGENGFEASRVAKLGQRSELILGLG